MIDLGRGQANMTDFLSNAFAEVNDLTPGIQQGKGHAERVISNLGNIEVGRLEISNLVRHDRSEFTAIEHKSHVHRDFHWSMQTRPGFAREPACKANPGSDRSEKSKKERFEIRFESVNRN